MVLVCLSTETKKKSRSISLRESKRPTCKQRMHLLNKRCKEIKAVLLLLNSSVLFVRRGRKDQNVAEVEEDPILCRSIAGIIHRPPAIEASPC
jgi:hypothetical protein